MSNRDSILSHVLRSPIWVWAMVLLVVFAVEIAVMLALSVFGPAYIGDTAKAFIDAMLLTVICAPLLWGVIIAPLRRIAIREYERSQTIVSNAAEGILTFNQNGIISSCNSAGAELFSIGAAATTGMHIGTLIPKLSWTKEPGSSEQRTTGFNSEGLEIPLHVSISNLASEDSWIAVVRDLTQSQKAESRRIQSARETEALRAQQMATLAQLATGVAHEIRNPLTSIKMMIQVNRDKFAESGLPTEDLELVEQEIRRMERSVTSLLEYARPEQSEFTDFPLQDAIENTRRLIEGQCLAQNVTLDFDLPNVPLFVFGDRTQIQQLLLNLCLNGLDAMPQGGTLTIVATEGVDSQACLKVVDTGCGIRDEVLDKLFSPFVTTKVNGVGLGLGICRRIAECHSGQLSGANNEQGCAEFQLVLPLTGKLNSQPVESV